jgi:hypothetical protein
MLRELYGALVQYNMQLDRDFAHRLFGKYSGMRAEDTLILVLTPFLRRPIL